MTTVHSLDEYRAALREIEYLWGSEPDTDEGRMLEDILAAVEKYEKLNTSMPTAQGFA